MTLWLKRGDKQKSSGNALFMLPFTSVIMGIDLSLHKVEIQFHFLLLISERLEFYVSELQFLSFRGDLDGAKFLL